MNESTSSSTNGSPGPVTKPPDKDAMWAKVVANHAATHAARKTGNQGASVEKPQGEMANRAGVAVEPRDEANAADFGQPKQVKASRESNVLGEIEHACQVVCQGDQDVGQAQFGSSVQPAINEVSATRKLTPYCLDSAKALHPKGFPDRKKGSDKTVLSTIRNLEYMLEGYGIAVSYDEIKKKLVVAIPGNSGSIDNQDNVALAHVYSLAILNCMSTGQIPSFLSAIADRNRRNPVADWILSKPWNGRDRYEEFCDSVQERKGYPEFMKKILLRRWLLSAVAAVLKTHGFHCRGVLVLQGRQGIGKSRFFQALVSDASLCASVVLLGHHLDGANKDSMTTAIAHWIVELGELDGTLKKDIARLKGFITSNSDKLRRPYGRLDSEYPRRTVFGASVNDNNFLVDDTGNSRWWTIACESINYAHGIDMQQLFAQFAVYFSNGEQWWLTPEEEQMLDEVNKSHRIVSMIRERVLGAIDLQPELGTQLPAMTAIELLEEVGVQRPTNPQCKECASILREIYGDPKKVNGRYVWRVALSHNTTDDPLHTGQSANSSSDEDDADLY